jgi:hypothetical protein
MIPLQSLEVALMTIEELAQPRLLLTSVQPELLYHWKRGYPSLRLRLPYKTD